MRLHTGTFIALLLLTATSGADTLGFVEQKFSAINFEKGKWTRTAQLPCYSYVAQTDGAVVEVLRYGTGNLVPFKATKQGVTVTVCSDIVAFDEGFETGLPIQGKSTRP
jgi:hypothetical protein